MARPGGALALPLVPTCQHRMVRCAQRATRELHGGRWRPRASRAARYDQATRRQLRRPCDRLAHASAPSRDRARDAHPRRTVPLITGRSHRPRKRQQIRNQESPSSVYACILRADRRVHVSSLTLSGSESQAIASQQDRHLQFGSGRRPAKEGRRQRTADRRPRRAADRLVVQPRRSYP